MYYAWSAILDTPHLAARRDQRELFEQKIEREGYAIKRLQIVVSCVTT